MSEVGLEIAVIFVLILANGFFSLAELSLVAARKGRLQNLESQGVASAKRALELIRQPEKFLAAVQTGVTVVGTLASVYGGATLVDYLHPKLAAIPALADYADPIAVTIVVVGISFLAIVVGELAPKYLALAHAEKIALVVSRPILIVSRALSYLIPILTGSAKLIVRLFGVRDVSPSEVVSELDVQLLMSEGRQSGVFDKEDEELVRSALDFADTTAREAMTPRTDIVGFDNDTSFEEIVTRMGEQGYSRYPVYRENIDRIAGVVFLKDVFKRLQERTSTTLNDIIRPAMFIPDSMELSEALSLMQTKRQHLAICLDEFGGTAGLLTLEDILEEIVGDIQDETDTEVAEFVAQSENVAFISGTLRPDQLNERFGTHLPDDQSTTVAGLLVSELERVPEKQERITLADVTITVLERRGSRIIRMRVEKNI